MLSTSPNEIKVVYDGACPFCSNYVRLLRLRETFDRVTLINARERPDLVRRCASAGFDLNEEMLVVMEGQTYGGARAMQILAMLSSGSSWGRRFYRWLFKSSIRAQTLYPFLRLGRKITLFIVRRPQIVSK